MAPPPLSMATLAAAEFRAVMIGGSLLAVNAGFINVVTLAGVFTVTVSHVTGNVSRIAITLFRFDMTSLILVTSVVFSYGFGAFVAGFMVGDAKFKLGQSYGYALLLESAMLLGSFIFLQRELLVGEWCAAFACGLQNALATNYSGMVVRTTHMTGIVTDIGNILGQACRRDTKAETWRLRVHVPLLVSYIVGGLFGQATYVLIGENALILPFLFTGIIALVYLNLPPIQRAAQQLRELAQHHAHQQPHLEVRYIGDPRTAGPNAAFLADAAPPACIDTDIQSFLSGLRPHDAASTAGLQQRRPVPVMRAAANDGGGPAPSRGTAGAGAGAGGEYGAAPPPFRAASMHADAAYAGDGGDNAYDGALLTGSPGVFGGGVGVGGGEEEEDGDETNPFTRAADLVRLQQARQARARLSRQLTRDASFTAAVITAAADPNDARYTAESGGGFEVVYRSNV